MDILLLILILYSGLVVYCTGRIAQRMEEDLDLKTDDMKRAHQRRVDKKNELVAEKNLLANETHRIFTLYEITKDITKSLDEKTAFDIFQGKLREHVNFQECLLLDPLSEDLKKYQVSQEAFVFPLKSKEEKVGYLVIKGVHPKKHEIVTILGNQFALALRRVKLYKEIERIAITDSLTQLFTRRHLGERFVEELKRAQSRKTKTSFLMLDVDHFKPVNDQYGHLTGDQVLREVAGLIKENIREIDIAGRYGGEEFCVVLPDTDGKGGLYVAERIRCAVEEAVIHAYDAKVRITVSIGISVFDEDGKNMEELIDKADWALYRAKKQGRNRVCAFGIYSNNDE